MATYTLSGVGTQALSANVTALHVTISTIPSRSGLGQANPASRYDIGLLRFGDGTAWWAPVAINGGPQWFGVPTGTTELGYNVFTGGVVSVTEVIGGTSPFVGSFPSLEQLTDVAISSVANGQVIEWDSGSSTWKNVTLSTPTPTLTSHTVSLGSSVTLTSTNTYFDIFSQSLVAGTWWLAAEMQIESTASNAITGRLWDGSTIYRETSSFDSNGHMNYKIHGIVTLGSTTTVKVSVAQLTAGSTVQRAAPWNSGGNFASFFDMFKIA